MTAIMTPLGIIFMGTPQFALPTLTALVESGHHVRAVYSQPPRPAGRGQKERLSPTHAYALEKNIAVYTPVTLKQEDAQRQFRSLNAHVAVVAAYGLLLPPAILEGTRMGCINIHPSLLPRWRGAAPIQRTVMAGDATTGIVIMQMNAGLDTGDMLLTTNYDIPEGTTAGSLHDTLSRMAAPMVLETLQGLSDQTIRPTRQPEDGATYAKKITKEECRIDWNESAQSLRNRILGLSPSPGAYFMHNAESIKILDAGITRSENRQRPGTVLDADWNIACGSDAIQPLILQRPGKKPTRADELKHGFSLAAGSVLE